MSRAKAAATAAALPGVNVESPDDRSPRNLHLNLLVDVIFINGTATFVALLGQRYGAADVPR